MRKFAFILAIVFLLISGLAGCRQQASPAPPAGEKEEYAYGEMEAGAVESFEITGKNIKTPVIAEREKIERVTEYISAAEFIGTAGGTKLPEAADSGMKVYLREKFKDSETIIISYNKADGNRLYLGPQGYEYIIESMELAEFIKGNLAGEVLLVEEDYLPEKAKQWFDTFGTEKGAYVYQHPDYTFIKINAGEKPTGGYSLSFDKLTEQEYPVEILVELTEPKEGEPVTEALTYPSLILKIESKQVTKYEIRSVDGDTYEVKEKIIFSKIDNLKEGDTISSPLRIKGKVLAFEGAFSIRILDKNEAKIHSEALQADSGGPAWGNYDAEFDFPVPGTKTGYIEVGEYSAKDGSWLARERIKVSFGK